MNKINKVLTVSDLMIKLDTKYNQLIKHINNLDSNIIVKIGAAYLRVSTDMQTEFSPEAQLDDIIRYCIQNNIMLPKDNIFMDAGISGTRADKRPDFQRMIKKAKEKSMDIIIVHKLDRFARNREDSIVYKSLLRKKLKIELVAVKEQLPEDKKMAMIMESQLEAYGEYYSMNLSDEVKKGLRKKAEKGEHIGRPPFGFIKEILTVEKDENGREKIRRQIKPEETECKYLKLIFEKVISCEPLNDIAKFLNDSGVKTKNNGLFSDDAIKRIIRNPIYLGYTSWCEGGMQGNRTLDGIIKVKSLPQIIDDDLWNKANQRLDTLDEIFKNRKYTVKHEHWLRGLLRCDNCGEIMTKNGDFFQCTGYTHGRCKISHSIKVYKVEEVILEEIKNTFKNKPIDIKISERISSFDNDIELLNQQLKQLLLKENRVKIAYENGIDNLEEYKENKLRIKNEIEKIKNLINSKNNEDIESKRKNEVYSKCGSAYEILIDSNVSVENKTLITHSLFEKIIFVKQTRKLVIYYK